MSSVPLPHGCEARIDTSLQELLLELASLLLRCGITPKAFAGFAKYAFARAAARTSKLGNGKVNHSRVSARTGLSRANVRSILQNGPVVSSPLDQSPLCKVIRGWRTDRRFTDPSGAPKHLKKSDGRGSFRHLVKSYASDIPHRAVLDELVEIGAVVIHKENVELRTVNLEAAQGAFRVLAPMLAMFVEALRLSSISSTPPKVWRLTSRIDSDIEDVRNTYKSLVEKLVHAPRTRRMRRRGARREVVRCLTIAIVQSTRKPAVRASD
jgi:hypothetical protein